MRNLILSLILFLCCLSATAQTPRPEYPRPQFERTAWVNLNGDWTYTLDLAKSGMDRELYNSHGFDNHITVPFCPESSLSGVGYKDFIPAMWYHRTITIPSDWQGQKIMLHFGAVDFYAVVYIDGKVMTRHWGGSTPFACDITEAVSDGKVHDLVLRVEDDQRSGTQPKGKQSSRYGSFGCEYTRTTGIWQTVWMEPVSPFGLADARIVAQYDEGRFDIMPEFYALEAGLQLEVIVRDGKKVVSKDRRKAAPGMVLSLPVKNFKAWSPESPFLYDIDLNVYRADGSLADHVAAYAGMRKVHVEAGRFFINNKPMYLRFVLDQGFYPDGIWTAPSDEALKHDIELSMAAGFNGARLHQKVFEPRFHYWADRLGYLTWGETANWGCNLNKVEAARNFLSEWETEVVRDRNHPSIIAWTPFNETWERPDNWEEATQADRFVRDAYRLSHDLDSRPVNDVSGCYHMLTDLWSVHIYEQNPDKLRETLTPKDGRVYQEFPHKEMPYGGQPYFVDEYGGIKWVVGQAFAENTWGYGEGPRTLEEFYARLDGLTRVLLGLPHIAGYCYTQLTDVEQEQNGIYNYDRTPKFDMKRIHAIFSLEPELK